MGLIFFNPSSSFQSQIFISVANLSFFFMILINVPSSAMAFSSAPRSNIPTASSSCHHSKFFSLRLNSKQNKVSFVSKLEREETSLKIVKSVLNNKRLNIKKAVFLEHSELDRAKKELEKQEKEIADARCKYEKIEEELKQANYSLTSQAREIEDLKRRLWERDSGITTLRSALSLKEGEIVKMRNEVMTKGEEVAMIDSNLKSKAQLLNQANEVVKEQEIEIQGLRKALQKKDEELRASMALREIEEEKLKVAESNLEKKTMEWLQAKGELKKLAEKASKHVEETNETLDDFRRVKKLLVDVRSELVFSQKALASSRKKMEEQDQVLGKQMEELEEQKRSVMSYMTSLKDAQIEIESERVKLRAKLEIQHLKSEQATLMVVLGEKDSELLISKKKLEEVSKEIADLKMLLNSRENQLIQATALLKEKDEQVGIIQNELNQTMQKTVEAENVVERIVELTNKLVISIKDESSHGIFEQPWENQLENELELTRETLRRKEMDVVAAQRSLAMKDEELKAIKEETKQDANDLRKLYSLAQERNIGEESFGDLAIEKLQLEASQLEVEAATSALHKLVEMSRELLNKTTPSIEVDDNFDHWKSTGENNECFAKVTTEVFRLSALTEELVKEAAVSGKKSKCLAFD
ncbi:hypothetical protein F8388_017890 [Cannabis sativa]|uniref:Uncharacterized protein n=1 Tax=Cannabis sativa TaxID=3483 RepID=A0A7J6F3N0_CANSA|nr:hypothetical protein F8388_017890 [Cannabis sativa]